MVKSKKILTVIPARSGSKRLKNKNIMMCGGKPLFQWSIITALESKYCEKIVVSTDSYEIAEAARSLNADVPYIRPEKLSQDTSTTFDVVKDLLDYYINQDIYFDYVLLLQPTSPLRIVQDIDLSIELLNKKSADCIVSVSEVDHSPLWSTTLPKDQSLAGFFDKEIDSKRSQDLEKYYRLNGAIYLCDTQKLLLNKSFIFEENVYAYVMPRERSVDIDTNIDLLLADTLFKTM